MVHKCNRPFCKRNKTKIRPKVVTFDEELKKYGLNEFLGKTMFQINIEFVFITNL